MFLTSLMPRLTSNHRRQTFQRRTRRLALDMLEDRRVLSTLFVDDDLAQRHNADYTSIQAAVDAAHAGDTIRVSPGIYNESVTVDKKLTIIGAQEGFDGQNGNAPNATNPAKASIVQIPAGGTAGFDLEANDIVIRGFTIEDADANGNNAVGINAARAYSGDTISNNVIQDTVFGIYLNTNGAHKTVVQNNLIRNNNNPGSASGNGIYSDQGASNVVIANNYFTGNTNASIIFVGGPAADTSQSKLAVKDNKIINDAPMIFVNTDGLQITNNTSTNSNGSGIFFGGGVQNAAVQNNKLTGGAFTGINLRPNAFGNAPDANTAITIKNSKISGFGDNGIRLDAATNVTVSKNDVRNNGIDGILLEDGATGNLVDKNHAEANAGVGIHADASTFGNTFTKNEAKNNTLFDYEDDSHGTGTAGTANTWAKNKGKTASPPGLLGH